jgi:hypothetical protein
MTELSMHPLASIFPLMDETSFLALKEDIAAHGVREPLWLYEGKVLDGRNRYQACQELGVDAPTREYTGADPLGFILSMNLQRRHLNESQRAMVAAKIANMRQGERTDRQPAQNFGKVSQAQASEMLNISDETLRYAKKVQAEAQPEVITAVETGRLAVSAAAKLAQESVKTQRAVVAKVRSGTAKTVAQAIKQVRAEANSRGGELRQPSPASNGEARAAAKQAHWETQVSELHKLRRYFAWLEEDGRIEALVHIWGAAETSRYEAVLEQLIKRLRRTHLRILTGLCDQVDGNPSGVMARRVLVLAESILYELAHWRRWEPQGKVGQAFDAMEQLLRRIQDDVRTTQQGPHEPTTEEPQTEDDEEKQRRTVENIVSTRVHQALSGVFTENTNRA